MSNSLERAWLIVALLWPVAVLNYLDRLMITTMREPLVAEISISDAQFGLLTSIFLWVYGALSPLGGYLADHYGRRRMILGSLVVWSSVTWLTGRMESFGGLLVVRACMGCSEACYIPAALALIADCHRGSTRSLATGIHTSGIYAGAALGGLGGWVAERFGWRVAFTVFGEVGIAYAVVLWLGLRFTLDDSHARQTEPAVDSTAEPDSVRLIDALRALATAPGFRLLALVNVLVSVSNWVLYGWLPTYMKDRFSLGLGAAGLSATAYFQAASLVGALAGGAWADAWSRRQPRARAWTPALGYLLAGPCLFVMASTDLLPLAIVSMIAFGLGRGIFDANQMPLLRQLVAARYSATGYGLLNLVGNLAGGAMVYLGGALNDAKIDLACLFQAAAVGIVVAGGILFAIRPRQV